MNYDYDNFFLAAPYQYETARELLCSVIGREAIKFSYLKDSPIMGDIDISLKNFIKINSVFAQIFSRGVYGGEIKIEPDKLYGLDTAEQETLRLEDGKLKNLERLRDAEKVTMLFDKKMAFQVILGVEGQMGVHYYMPVRCMELDALAYSGQCKKISEKAKENRELKKYAEYIDRFSEKEMTEGVNMDAALEYIVEEGRIEGRTEGRAAEIIETGYEFGLTEDEILKRLQNKLRVSLCTAKEYFTKFRELRM